MTFPSPLSPLPAGSLVPKWNGKWGPASGMKLPFPVYFMTELSDIPEPRWLVKNLLVEGSHHVIWGEPQSGKSLWALDMALCLATGIPWQQHASFDPVTSLIGPTYPVKRSNVLYLAGEGTQGLRARSDAWRQRYGLTVPEFAELNQPLVGSATVIPEAFQVNPLNPDYAAGLTAVVEQAEINVVVVDTLSRYYVGDENQQEAMGRYINFVDSFMKAGITVITIHHANKGGSERGSSVLRGAADINYKLESPQKNGELVTRTVVECHKFKDGRKIHPLHMDLVEYRVPTDMLTSVALQLTDAPVAAKVASPELVRGEAVDRIYDLVSSQDMYTVESIRKELGIRKELVSQYLTQMVEQGMLKPKEKGQKYERTD